MHIIIHDDGTFILHDDGTPLFPSPFSSQDFAWIFLDGPCDWQPLPGATQLHLAERRLAHWFLTNGAMEHGP